MAAYLRPPEASVGAYGAYIATTDVADVQYIFRAYRWLFGCLFEPAQRYADEFESYATALDTHLTAPGTLTCQPLMWQAWGRVPLAGAHGHEVR